MYNPNILDFDDFYFNGHFLSEFDGVIGGKDNGLPSFQPVPQKEIKVENGIIGRDGEIVYGSIYSPRVIEVPILLEDLSRIRDIAGWLDVPMPTDFYFKGDTLKIKAMYDQSVDLETGIIESNLGGLTSIKFICHYPFYSAITDAKWIFKNSAVNRQTSNADGSILTFETTDLGNSMTFANQGNRISYPLIKILGTGDITLTINGTTLTVKNIVDYVYVDTKYMTVYKDSATNKFVDFSGTFVNLVAGNNTISVSGTGICTQVEIQCNSEWI